MPIKVELTEEQKVQKQISAMGDSVNLINRLIAGDKHTQQVHDTIDRNVRHLELMLDKDHIKGAGVSLDSFSDAVESGKDFINQPVA